MDKKYALVMFALVAVALLYIGGYLPFQIINAPYGTPLSDWINGGSGTVEYVGGRDLSVFRFTCDKGGYPSTTFCYVMLLGGMHADSPPNDIWTEGSGTMYQIGESYYGAIAPNQMARLWYRYYTTWNNGVCDANFGETESNCPTDCGPTATTTTTTIYTPPWVTTTTTQPIGTTTTTTPIVCTADMQQCPDGSYVARNPADNCNFYPCEGEDYTIPIIIGGLGAALAGLLVYKARRR